MIILLEVGRCNRECTGLFWGSREGRDNGFGGLRRGFVTLWERSCKYIIIIISNRYNCTIIIILIRLIL